MGALADILLEGADPIVALALIVLFIGEGLIGDYVRRRMNRLEERIDSRLERVEDALISADGGRQIEKDRTQDR